MPDKNDFSELISDLLRGQDKLNSQMEELRRENRENSDRIISDFNTFVTAVVDRLNSIDTRLTRLPM